MKFFSIVWRCFLGGFLLFQLVFFTSGQVQSAKMYVPICIDQVFDLRTGEFGEKDPSLCGSGTRMGEGRYGDDGPGSGWRDYRPAGITFDRDFQFEEDTGDDLNEGPNVLESSLKGVHFFDAVHFRAKALTQLKKVGISFFLLWI